MSHARTLQVVDLGRLAYGEALALQRAVAAARISGAVPHDTLLLVEHPPVITTGRSTKGSNTALSAEVLAARGVALFDVERGGDATFHGPGQLVGYPIIDLKQHTQDLHWYLRQVEEALIRGIAPFGVTGSRVATYTGVWVGDRKLASIGVHARDWVTRHGFALNVHTDLSYFDLIVPCGIANVVMTSLARELGPAAPMLDVVSASVVAGVAEVFGFAVVQPVTRDALALALPEPVPGTVPA